MLGDTKSLIDYLLKQDKDKVFELKVKRGKRSLSQNAYAWSLINEIGNVLRKSKEEVYFEMLKNYGQCEIISMKASISIEDYFKYYETIGVEVIDDEEYINYKVYKGSSEFDSREMSIFVDGLTYEAEQLGIPTIEQERVKKMRL